MWLGLLTLTVSVSLTCALHHSDAPTDGFIHYINTVQDSWTAGRNFYPGSSIKNLLSVLPARDDSLPELVVAVKPRLPESFDSVSNWKRCGTVGKVREQGNCASAWALVAAAVFSDRLCIRRVGGGEISPQNILACCKHCGVSCLGGYLTDALTFLAKHGAPTRRCQPYELFPCPRIQGTLSCPAVRAVNPRCRAYCKANYFKRQPYQDLRRSGWAYSLANSSDVIRSDLVARGPVAAIVDVYEDLLAYRGGVYRHTAGSLLGQQPVKIVGWGQEGDTPYWLVLNTWGTLWGDHGYVKIVRDRNGINLENRVFSVLPEPVEE